MQVPCGATVIALLMVAGCGRLGFAVVDGDGGIRDGSTAVDVSTDGLGDLVGGTDVVCAAPPAAMVALALGRASTCAVTGTTIYCWGANQSGQLGLGDTMARFAPAPITVLTPTAAVSVGADHACATSPAGVLACWGENADGQLGTGDTSNRTVPFSVGNNYASPAAGGRHTCAVRTAGVYCWGNNDFGQLGQGDRTARPDPTQVPRAGTWSLVVAGDRHTCGEVTPSVAPVNECWGANEHGQVGGGDTNDRLTPMGVGGANVTPRLGGYHTVALRAGPNLEVWGGNDVGQLGLGDTMDRTNAVTATGLWSSVAAGAAHSCAIDSTTGRLYCWGANDHGQLGLGAPGTFETTPQQVGVDSDWQTVFAGGNHTCATKSDRRVFCWGQNQGGQLGLGHMFVRWSPAQVCVP